MTQAEMRLALGLGPDWEVICTGANPSDSHQRLCGGLYGPGRTYGSEWVILPSRPPGVRAWRRHGASGVE